MQYVSHSSILFANLHFPFIHYENPVYSHLLSVPPIILTYLSTRRYNLYKSTFLKEFLFATDSPQPTLSKYTLLHDFVYQIIKVYRLKKQRSEILNLHITTEYSCSAFSHLCIVTSGLYYTQKILYMICKPWLIQSWKRL